MKKTIIKLMMPLVAANAAAFTKKLGLVLCPRRPMARVCINA